MVEVETEASPNQLVHDVLNGCFSRYLGLSQEGAI